MTFRGVLIAGSQLFLSEDIWLSSEDVSSWLQEKLLSTVIVFLGVLPEFVSSWWLLFLPRFLFVLFYHSYCCTGVNHVILAVSLKVRGCNYSCVTDGVWSVETVWMCGCVNCKAHTHSAQPVKHAKTSS